MNSIMTRFLERGNATLPAPSVPNSDLSMTESTRVNSQQNQDPIEQFSDSDDQLPHAGHDPREPSRIPNDIRSLLGMKPLNKKDKYPLFVHPSHHLSLTNALFEAERSTNPRSYNRTCLRSAYSHLLELPFTHNFPMVDSLDFVSCLEFDSKGSLLCAASSNGNVIVHDFDSLVMLWSSRRSLYEKGCSRLAKIPVSDRPLAMKRGLPKLNLGSLECAVEQLKVPFRVESMKFNPHNEDQLGLTGTSKGEVFVFDLAKSNTNGRKYKSSHNHGMTTLQFCNSDLHTLVGGGVSGVVTIWDVRCSNKPRHEMKSALDSSSPIRALSFDNTGYLLWQCRKDGVIAVSDMRKAASSIKNRGLGHFLKVIRFPLSGLTMFDAQFDPGNCGILTVLNDQLAISRFCLGSGEVVKSVQVNERRHRDENIRILSQIFRFKFSLFKDRFAATGGYLPVISTVDLSTSQDLGLAIREQNLIRKRNGEVLDLYPSKVMVNDTWSVVSRVNLDAHVAVTAVHPSLPYVVCGTTANKLRVLGNDFQKFDWGSCEEEKEVTG